MTTRRIQNNFKVSTNPKEIAEQNKLGFEQLLEGGSLPSKVHGQGIEKLLEAGVVLGEPYEQDPMFRPATLPEGWTLKAFPADGEHYAVLLDNQETPRPRAQVFYRAEAGARRAFINVL